MTERRAFTIRYHCGHVRAWPPEEAPAEIGEAIGRRPCPDCRRPWSPPEPGVIYRFAVEAADGAPLALPYWPCLYLCDFHDEEATAKGVEAPEGVDRRVGLILPVTKAGLMLCNVCDGDVAIVAAGAVPAAARRGGRA